MRIRLLLAYDGTEYSGWQIQEKPAAPPTVQGVVEAALFKILSRKIRVYGSGRTDAGVHAYGQVAHFDLDGRAVPGDLAHALNAVLPADVRVLGAGVVADDFNARASAISKTYVYHYWQEKSFLPPQLRLYVWDCGALDVEAMVMAAQALVGWHDFASFQNAGTPVRDTCREIKAIQISALPPQPFYPQHLPMLKLEISANGFLKQMARNIAGCLFYVARGKIRPEAMDGILAAKDRRQLAAPTAPARGLALARVEYGAIGI